MPAIRDSSQHGPGRFKTPVYGPDLGDHVAFDRAAGVRGAGKRDLIKDGRPETVRKGSRLFLDKRSGRDTRVD